MSCCFQEKNLPYAKKTCVAISFVKSLYQHVFSVLTLSMLLAQVDFFLVRTCADLIVTTIGTFLYIKDKNICSRENQVHVDDTEMLMSEK